MNYGDLTDAGCDACQVGRLHWGPRMRKAIGETLTELGSTLRLSEPTTTFTVTPNVGDYSIATALGVSDARMVRDLFYQPVGQNQALPPLRRTSPSRIDELRARSSGQAYPWYWAQAGVDKLLLGPVPTDAGTLTVRYVQDIGYLAADSDVPALLPIEFHDLIWLGAAAKVAPLRRPRLPLADIQMLQQTYKARLGDLRSWLVDLGGEEPIKMQRVGGPIPYRDPSIYPAFH